MFGGAKPTFGQPANTGFGTFGSTNNTASPFAQSAFNKPANSGFGSNTFGQPAANTSLFGGTTNQNTGLFGSTTTNTFSQQQQQPQTGFGSFNQQPQQQPSLFGAAQQQPQQNTSLFGQNQASSAFGAKPSGFGTFGTQQPTSNTSLFGQPSTSNASSSFGFNQPAQSGGIFGASVNPTPAFTMGATTENAGSSIAKYTVSLDTDTMMVKGNQSNISTKQHCITFMKEYANKSLEEIRIEDYLANRKGPQAGSSTLFGQPQSSGMFGQPAAPQTGIFGQTQTAQPSTGLFGATNTGLGGNAFGQTNTFNQPTQAGSMFGTAKPFGTATTQSGFGFGSTVSATVAPFGQKPTFGTAAPSTGLFGSTQTNTFNQQPISTGFGGFGQAQQQQVSDKRNQ